ncbi:response regulator [Aureimonas altamirensis]|uniref:response regulator n=1 Tax=Aureimonas altamirensis TaxID=370622 RepID=UPI002036A38C|nr:response regulator [Aureimonas altamirensis]MCM2503842.1 response regulator [Aureimonas altamirensis]
MPDLSRITVLVVDDSPDSLAVLTETLEREGADVLVARSGDAALGIVARVKPDIVLLDALMPGRDGFETCRALKADESSAGIPVIFMTGLDETEHIVRAFSVGGVDYVTKPFAVAEVIARIEVHGRNASRSRLVQRALETSGRHLVATDAQGRVSWVSAEARAALQGGARLHDDPRTISPGETIEAAGQTLRLLGACGPSEYLFELLDKASAQTPEDVLKQGFGLTTREAEVLIWLVRGKSNRDIATILSLSPRTVDKHLETVFRKLGVENRTSAVALAVAKI